MKKIFYILLVLPALVLAQSSNQNYVKNITYKQPVDMAISNPTALQAKVDVTYFDGFGMPIQLVAHNQSGTGMDIVTPIVYDDFGRQTKDYLPVPVTTNSMLFIDNAAMTDNPSSYYSTSFGTDGAYRYSDKRIEDSPLGRVLEQGAPGLNWEVKPTSDIDHTIKFGYLTNGNLTIRRFVAFATWDVTKGLYITSFANPDMSMFYSGNQLYVNITKDENWTSGLLNTTEEYKNKEGQIVLKRNYNIVNNIVTSHDTYYVYDQFGNLTYVIPPLATGNISAKLDDLCYQYRYDQRNRLVEKKLPGKQWEFIVYDKLDRVVATGPANSPFTNLGGTGWLITKYDAFDRPVLTGWLSSTTVTAAGRKSLQATISGLTALNEVKTAGNTTINNIPFRYSTVAWPTAGYHVLTTNYYDDYDYNGAPTSFSVVLDTEQAYYNNSTLKPKGLPTGSWVRVLTTSTSTAGETSHTLYDKKARPVRTHTANYLGGYTYTDSKLDFEGKVLYTVTYHKRLAGTGSTEIKTREDFTYTDQGRLLTHTHKINNAANAELIAKNEYDELGQLKVKRVGGATAGTGLQKVDYSYNIRGWLKSINNTDTGGLAEGGTIPVDLFAFKLNYNTVEAPNAAGTALYNGNISETYWKTYPENVRRKYSYAYDNLNRLTDAVYVKPGLMNPVTNSYNESMRYDLNGNITHLDRNGYLDSENGDIYPIDNLSYVYDPGTNVLRKVDDLSNSLDGFRDVANPGADYFYDANGNMTGDLNKGIQQGGIIYNHLNLPTRIDFQVTQGQKFIEYIYNAVGAKVGKRVLNQGPGVNEYSFTDYMGGFQYVNDALQFFPTAEGYVSVTDGIRFNYVYNYKDHLGNTRLSYTDDGGVLKTLEENHYYPFGMRHTNYGNSRHDYVRNPDGTGYAVVVPVERNKYQYKYNGKEYQDELLLNLYDYGARNYDPTIGRWNVMDGKAELYPGKSPYIYALNTPIQAIDPDGNIVIFINGMHEGDGGTKDYWRNGNIHFDTMVMDKLDDHFTPRYYDGSHGGKGGMLNPSKGSNLRSYTRQFNGYGQGMKDAKSIIDNLARDQTTGEIIETIKIVTHSMGGAYGKGFVRALKDYIAKLPKEMQRQIKITMVADFDPFQAESLEADPEIYTQQFSHINKKGRKDSDGHGWLANERQKGDDEYIEDENESGHSIFLFLNNLNNLKEGTYIWNGSSWECITCK